MAEQQTGVEWLTELVLSEQERELLSLVVQPDSLVEKVADNLTDEQLWMAISVCVRAYSTVKRAQGQLKPVLGKLLIVLESHPEVYKSHGFLTYDDFLTRGAPSLLGLPRSEAYRAKRLATAWPNLSPADHSELGEGKLYLLSRITNSEDPKSSKWLDLARSSTKDELIDMIAQAGKAPKETLLPAVITIQTTLEIKQHWNAFISSPQVHSIVGSENAGSILSAVLAEVASSWAT